MENWLWIVVVFAVGVLILGIGSGFTGKAVGVESSNRCYDSDGINANIPGLIQYKWWIFPVTTQVDTCTFDKKSVNEKYCNTNSAATKKISCLNGCILIPGYAFGKNVTAGTCAP
jgi:hypothetical protein